VGRLTATIALLFAVLTLSCGELPTAPRQRIILTGTITDPTGTPLSGVTLYFRLLNYRSYYEGEEVLTVANGTFQVELPTGEYYVDLSRIGYVSRSALITVSPSVSQFDYRFEGVTISGSMSGPGGAPVSDVIVSVSGRLGGGFAEVTGNAYSILAPRGCYSMGFRSGTPGLPTIRWPQVCVTSDTTLPVALDGHLVTGTVSGRGNVGRVTVAAFYGDGVQAAWDDTDGAGVYSLLLQAGSYTFVAVPYDSTFIMPFSRGLTAVTAPMALDWDLTGAEWSGIVRRASTLDPTQAGVFAYRRYAHTGSYTTASALAQANGAFRLILQPGFLYDLEAWSLDGYWQARGVAAGADSTLNILLSGHFDAPRGVGPDGEAANVRGRKGALP
jgi:carboxypeptidase family protein